MPTSGDAGKIDAFFVDKLQMNNRTFEHENN